MTSPIESASGDRGIEPFLDLARRTGRLRDVVEMRNRCSHYGQHDPCGCLSGLFDASGNLVETPRLRNELWEKRNNWRRANPVAAQAMQPALPALPGRLARQRADVMMLKYGALPPKPPPPQRIVSVCRDRDGRIVSRFTTTE